jgi:hypothetical protein
MALEVAPDIKQAIQDGTLSMADCKSAAYFVQECILDHLLDGKVVGYLPITSRTTPRQWDGFLDTPVEENPHSLRRCFTASASANWLLEEDRQIAPTGLAGKTSWVTFEEGFPEGMDEQFLAHFTNRFPLPLPFSPNSSSFLVDSRSKNASNSARISSKANMGPADTNPSLRTFAGRRAATSACNRGGPPSQPCVCAGCRAPSGTCAPAQPPSPCNQPRTEAPHSHHASVLPLGT